MEDLNNRYVSKGTQYSRLYIKPKSFDKLGLNCSKVIIYPKVAVMISLLIISVGEELFEMHFMWTGLSKLCWWENGQIFYKNSLWACVLWDLVNVCGYKSDDFLIEKLFCNKHSFHFMMALYIAPWQFEKALALLTLIARTVSLLAQMLFLSPW